MCFSLTASKPVTMTWLLLAATADSAVVGVEDQGQWIHGRYLCALSFLLCSCNTIHHLSYCRTPHSASTTSLPEEVLLIQIRSVEHLCCPFRAPVTWLGSCTWWSMSLRCHWHTDLGDTSAFHTPGAFMHCPAIATHLGRLPAIWWCKISHFNDIRESKLLRGFFSSYDVFAGEELLLRRNHYYANKNTCLAQTVSPVEKSFCGLPKFLT